MACLNLLGSMSCIFEELSFSDHSLPLLEVRHSMTIYIGNLSFDAEKEDIVGVFSTYGEVTNCKLPLERETGRKRGFAFVDMADEAQEQKAIDDLQDVEWMGRSIRVTKAVPRNNGGGGNRDSRGPSRNR